MTVRRKTPLNPQRKYLSYRKTNKTISLNFEFVLVSVSGSSACVAISYRDPSNMVERTETEDKNSTSTLTMNICIVEAQNAQNAQIETRKTNESSGYIA